MSRPDSSKSRKPKPVLSHRWTTEEYRSMSKKLVSSGDISRLDALIDLWASTESYSRGMSSGVVQTTRQTATGLLASVRDRKGRTLLHLAARFVHPEMIIHLIESGCSTKATDNRGNTVLHLLLRSLANQVKSKTAHSSRKRKRKQHCGPILNYIQCCRLVKRILDNDCDLLTVSNDRGQKSTEWLQQLWDLASEEERRIGDQILVSSLRSVELDSRNESNHRDRFYDTRDHDQYDSSEDCWYGDDEGDPRPSGGTYDWEEYFSDFLHTEPRSHLDTIREEYERRQRSALPNKARSLEQGGCADSVDRERADFLRRHQEALGRRRDKSAMDDHTTISLEAFKQQWSLFLSQSAEIRSLHVIPWPPFCGPMGATEDRVKNAELRIQSVLQFVHHQLDELRQLQIQWHPDRFASRMSQSLHPEIKDSVMQKVNAISQLLNASMDALRTRGERVASSR